MDKVLGNIFFLIISIRGEAKLQQLNDEVNIEDPQVNKQQHFKFA